MDSLVDNIKSSMNSLKRKATEITPNLDIVVLFSTYIQVKSMFIG